MRIFAIIAGLLVALFGGGCLALVPIWTTGPIFVFGWLPVMAGLGLVGYAVLHRRGTPFPMPLKVVVWIVIVTFIAVVVFIFYGVAYLDFRLAG